MRTFWAICVWAAMSAAVLACIGAAILANVAAGAATASFPASEPAASRPSRPLPRISVVVFDFAGDEELGKELADSVRLRLARHKEYDVVDQLTTQGCGHRRCAGLGAGEDR